MLQLRLGVKREAATGRALVLPWVIGFLIFNVFAIGASLYLSFTDYNLVQRAQMGRLDNYDDLFNVNVESAQRLPISAVPTSCRAATRKFSASTSPTAASSSAPKQTDFWRAMRLTLPFAFLSVPVGLFAALGVALLLNQKVRLLGFWRVLYYMPAILPVVATALLWRWIFSPNSGLINNLLAPVYNLFGWETPRWFTDPNLALPAFIIISLWGAFGANSVILLAGLKGIPKELYEAADIDGGGRMGEVSQRHHSDAQPGAVLQPRHRHDCRAGAGVRHRARLSPPARRLARSSTGRFIWTLSASATWGWLRRKAGLCCSSFWC